MTKFLVLYNSPVSAAEMMANASPEETKAGMDAWTAWSDHNGESVIDLGLPLGSSTHIAPGSSAPGSTEASGYSIVQADDLEAATKMLEDHPHLQTPGGTIDVLECLSMPGM
jgi:hypothetical protein